MPRALRLRRYLVHFSSHNIPQLFTDVLVIGSGIAGLTAALQAAAAGSVLVVTKGELCESTTNEAQGGIAAAVGSGDSISLHFEDTVKGGAGLCEEHMVRVLTDEAPMRIKDLERWGVRFDTDNRHLALGREGGHSKARILHADGDATGAAIAKALSQRTLQQDGIDVLERTFAIDLLTLNGACHGALIWNRTHGLMMAHAKQTVLASGGCGRLFRETTNPPVVTGDGLAMAFRAGAELTDLEFMQFHPTTLYVAGASRALISEAVRGEGGILRNKSGERFMPRYHPDAELAPRDTVSLSILQEMKRTQHTHVYLDMTGMSRERLQQRFPTITALCDSFGLNVAEDMIPVRPAAHYMIGGVKVNENCQTNVRNLLACGEIACTGVHGANRLGSNSLLEGLVFGHRAAAYAAANLKTMQEPLPVHAIQGLPQRPAYGTLNLVDVENSLKSLMWRNVGVERNQRDLDDAMDTITFWCRYMMDKEFEQVKGWELQNMLTVARLVAMSARQREESRGVHYRTDFPHISENWRRHIIVANTGPEWL